MHDQASHLRSLVFAEARDPCAPLATSPRIVAIAGGKGGVGATTLAVNLALALSSEGQRVLLVDADLHRADAALLCGWHEGCTLADVLEAHRSVHEAIHAGPRGLQVLPGGWSLKRSHDGSAALVVRLVKQLREMGDYADVVLLDIGTGMGATARRYWQVVDEVVLVTTPEPASVMDAYATVKMLATVSDSHRVLSLVNQASDERSSADVHDRLRQACRRFLGLEIVPLGAVRRDPAVAAAARALRPVLLLSPKCDAASDMTCIARRWVGPAADILACRDST